MDPKPIFIFILLCFVATTTSAKVLIIGAGASGIAVATKLLENGYDDFEIVEAENRYGGRVRSVKIGDAYVDLGGEWCVGENSVYDMVKDLDVLQEFQYANQIVHTSEDWSYEFSEKLLDIYEYIYEQDNNLEAKGMSVGEFFHKNYIANITETFSSNQTLLEKAKEAEELFERFIMATEGCTNLDTPSADEDYEDAPGNPLITWNGNGFRTALDVLMKIYPDPSKKLPVLDKTTFNRSVRKIKWDQEKPIVEFTGDDATKEYDLVVFTPSVGVLKERHEELFEPKLSEKKIKAIESVGLEVIVKIVLRFEEKWWDTETFPDYSFAWGKEDKRKVTDGFQEGPKDKDGFSWVTSILTFLPAPGNNPKVIIGWLVGPIVYEVEKLPWDTVKKGAMIVLNLIYGKNYTVTEPSEIIVTDWGANANFRGTYSYQTVTAKTLDFSPADELSRPLFKGEKAVVRFAGEATHPTHYGTVHGAIETGIREANKILEETNKTKK